MIRKLNIFRRESLNVKLLRKNTIFSFNDNYINNIKFSKFFYSEINNKVKLDNNQMDNHITNKNDYKNKQKPQNLDNEEEVKILLKKDKKKESDNFDIEDVLNENLINLIKLNKQNEYIKNFPFTNFNENDKNILKSFKNKKTTFFLSNNNTKSRYLLSLGIMNKIFESKDNCINSNNNHIEQISKEENGIFLSPTNILKNKKINTKQKKFDKPRGALIISEKPEISMIYYRLFRLLDNNKKIRLSRIGSSMMAMSPIAEFQDVIYKLFYNIIFVVSYFIYFYLFEFFN